MFGGHGGANPPRSASTGIRADPPAAIRFVDLMRCATILNCSKPDINASKAICCVWAAPEAAPPISFRNKRLAKPIGADHHAAPPAMRAPRRTARPGQLGIAISAFFSVAPGIAIRGTSAPPSVSETFPAIGTTTMVSESPGRCRETAAPSSRACLCRIAKQAGRGDSEQRTARLALACHARPRRAGLAMTGFSPPSRRIGPDGAGDGGAVGALQNGQVVALLQRHPERRRGAEIVR